MRLVKKLLFLLFFVYNTAFGYIGSFKPELGRNSAEITFIDSQVPGATCLTHSTSIVDWALSPLVMQATACAIYTKGIVVVPLTYGPGTLYGLTMGTFPDAQLGHEFYHMWAKDNGNFHPPFVSFFDTASLLGSSSETSRSVCSAEHQRNVQTEAERLSERLRVSSKGETKCVIFIDACKVSFSDFGELARACINE